MDVRLECKISLSKKLRAILGNDGGRVMLIAENTKDGVGDATILLSSDAIDMNSINQNLNKETSIQITPLEAKHELPANTAVGSIFSTGNISQKGIRTPVDRIAAIEAPETKEVPHAIKKTEEIETPKVFSQTKEPSYQRFITDYASLMNAVREAQNKDSGIDIDSITDPRKRALAIEQKELAESIDDQAFIVNDTCGSVQLNDIDLDLNLNMPLDLSRISAKRLALSHDLKSMLNSKVIKFIKPDEVDIYREKAEKGIVIDGLETYSTRYEAESSIGGVEQISERDHIDIPVDDDGPNEQEQLAGLINLTPMASAAHGGSRRSVHGSPMGMRSVSHEGSTNPKGIKTISKARLG